MKDNIDPSPPIWVTLTELAERWKVCKRTIKRIPIEKLPCYNLPTQRRYRLQDIVQYERAHRMILPPTLEDNGHVLGHVPETEEED